ncbi:MAG: aspartate aminotransferase family protein [Acidobacteriota bacterium]|nr:aspartate aminotransferase family protein [Acidobacteriota bacterium]
MNGGEWRSASGALFSRNLHRRYPLAARAEGSWIYTDEGKKVLDAAGSAAVVSIGHGVAQIGQAMAEQAAKLAFVHSSEFQTRIAQQLAERLLALAPSNFQRGGRVFLTSGGSEATETAIKLCRQYFVERGETRRLKIVSRRQSYHGSTIGALSVSGNTGRREPFLPLLAEWGHIAPCYCYRCPLGLEYPQCNVACADELEKYLEENDPETVAAFIFEPVSGATLGAVAPPAGYAERIAEICRRHGILLIADEVMTGIGRTGKPFAVDHWGVKPDVLLVGKGVASGYAPLGAVLASTDVADAFVRGSGRLIHGFTYSAHPVAAAAGVAVLDYIQEKHLFNRVAPTGVELGRALEALRNDSAIIGDVRGLGLLWGIEFVRDRESRTPFEAAAQVADLVFDAAYDAGVLTYPIHGCVDGTRGDHLLLAPPFILSSEEIADLVVGLKTALGRVEQNLSNSGWKP